MKDHDCASYPAHKLRALMMVNTKGAGDVTLVMDPWTGILHEPKKLCSLLPKVKISHWWRSLVGVRPNTGALVSQETIAFSTQMQIGEARIASSKDAPMHSILRPNQEAKLEALLRQSRDSSLTRFRARIVLYFPELVRMNHFVRWDGHPRDSAQEIAWALRYTKHTARGNAVDTWKIVVATVGLVSIAYLLWGRRGKAKKSMTDPVDKLQEAKVMGSVNETVKKSGFWQPILGFFGVGERPFVASMIGPMPENLAHQRPKAIYETPAGPEPDTIGPMPEKYYALSNDHNRPKATYVAPARPDPEDDLPTQPGMRTVCHFDSRRGTKHCRFLPDDPIYTMPGTQTAKNMGEFQRLAEAAPSITTLTVEYAIQEAPTMERANQILEQAIGSLREFHITQDAERLYYQIDAIVTPPGARQNDI